MLEVLIATSLFVIVMVFTLGTVGQNVSFQSKLRTEKEVSVESRKFVDLISRDIKESNVSAKIDIGSGTAEFKDGLAMLDCNTGCILKYNFVPSTPDFNDRSDRNANVLIVAKNEKYKIYSADYNKKIVYFAEIPFLSLRDNTLTLSEIIKTSKEENRISSKRAETLLLFAGFCPEKSSSVKIKPYVQLQVESKTVNYDTLQVRNRAQSIIRTLITSRKY